MYYDACVYDLCVTLPDDDLVCADIDAYASACRQAGGVPGNWRAELTQCGMLTIKRGCKSRIDIGVYLKID